MYFLFDVIKIYVYLINVSHYQILLYGLIIVTSTPPLLPTLPNLNHPLSRL